MLESKGKETIKFNLRVQNTSKFMKKVTQFYSVNFPTKFH